MKDKYVSKMIDLVRRGGDIAISLMNDSQPDLKKDFSVITQADKNISAFIQSELAPLVKVGGHIIIDEEDVNHRELLGDEILDNAEYIWVLDPVDGTRPYANQMPFFGISLGVLRNRKPWLGAVYFPAMNELFYTDGKEAFFVQNAFSDKEVKRKIVPIDEEISQQSIFLCSDSFFNQFNWKSESCHLIIPTCAVIDLCWPTIGRGCGSLMRCSIWDYGASWAIVQYAGLQLRSIETGQVMEELRLADVQIDRLSWKLSDFYILSSERNFSVLRDILK